MLAYIWPCCSGTIRTTCSIGYRKDVEGVDDMESHLVILWIRELILRSRGINEAAHVYSFVGVYY